MIVVTVEVWKQGNPNDKELVGTLRIANAGEQNSLTTYVAELQATRDRYSVRGVIADCGQKKSAWALIREAIQVLARGG